MDRAFADVSYNDPDNNVTKAQSFEFTSKKADTAQFSVKLPPGARHLPISYAVSANNKVAVHLSVGTEDDLVDRKAHTEAFVLALKFCDKPVG